MQAKQFYQYTFYENGDVINDNTGKAMKKHYNKYSCEIRLSINKKQRSFIYTRLYYYLFVEEFDLEDTNLCVRVKDGNIHNVCKDNLELKTRKELLTDETTRKFKLSKTQAENIKKEYNKSREINGRVPLNQFDRPSSYLSYKQLSEKYGVTKSNIARIVKSESINQEECSTR